MSDPMNGRNYLRALQYALKATPRDEEQAALQHVTFHADRVTGADRVRRHDGYLPAKVEHASVTRACAQELAMALDYAHRFSKRRSGTFSVRHERDDMAGQHVVIEYGARHPLVHPLTLVDVGGWPEGPQEWVPPDAPVNPAGLGHIGCAALRDAVSWWRTWDKDVGTTEVRGGAEGGPLRMDITAGGERVATAFILPLDHVGAELPDTLPLFDGPGTGKSNLSLDLSGNGRPPLAPVVIRIGEEEINVTGLAERPEELLKQGPCDHRDTSDACLSCTREAVAEARAAL